MSVRRRCIRPIVVLASSAVVVGCGFPDQDRARPVSPDELPAGLRPGSVPESVVTTESERATVWLVEGDTLVASRHEVEAPATVESVTAELLVGPSESEQARGLRSALPDPTVVVGADLSRGVATVALTSTFGEISPHDQLLAVGQFVLTLTDLRGVGSVRFTLDEAPVAVPIPTGETSEEPVVREQFLELSRPPDGS
jgi:spore germination protein GerM